MRDKPAHYHNHNNNNNNATNVVGQQLLHLEGCLLVGADGIQVHATPDLKLQGWLNQSPHSPPPAK
jgi:hypothetical protein